LYEELLDVVDVRRPEAREAPDFDPEGKDS
jgi:hypothetical protein